MKYLRFAGKAICALITLGVIAVFAIRISAGEAPRKLRIIYTNDMMGYLEPCG